jgi:hypothetical protein
VPDELDERPSTFWQPHRRLAFGAGRWTCSTGDKRLRQRHSARKAIGPDFIWTIRRWRSRDARTHRTTWRRIGCSIRPRRYGGDCHSASTRHNHRHCTGKRRVRIRFGQPVLARHSPSILTVERNQSSRSLQKNGGSDGTRTRGLLRDRQTF